MEERKTSNDHQENLLRNTELEERQGSGTEEKKGITADQLSNITRSPSERGAGGATTKKFITGNDADGQL